MKRYMAEFFDTVRYWIMHVLFVAAIFTSLPSVVC